MNLREKVLHEAKKWLGTPYHHAARVRGAGVDCAMLLCEVYEAAGLIPHTEPEPYPMQWHLHRDEERFLGWIKKFGIETTVDNAKPGDVALFRFGRCVSHGGIITKWPNIIHAHMISRGVVAATATHADLAKRFHSVWTFEAFNE